MDIEQARFNMVEQQIRPWDVLDTDVLDLFHCVPREAFVSNEQAVLAFADLELPIGQSQVMMSPKVEGRMLQALKLTPDDKVLEIGTGSGFITACLAKMSKHVTSYEYFEDLYTDAKNRLNSQMFENVDCINGDIFESLDSLGKYDVIALTGSLPAHAEAFKKYLNLKGRMFCILGERPVMTAKLITCVGENNYREDDLFETDLPALLSTRTSEEFSF